MNETYPTPKPLMFWSEQTRIPWHVNLVFTVDITGPKKQKPKKRNCFWARTLLSTPPCFLVLKRQMPDHTMDLIMELEQYPPNDNRLWWWWWIWEDGYDCSINGQDSRAFFPPSQWLMPPYLNCLPTSHPTTLSVYYFTKYANTCEYWITYK